jgi:hypothetical protein
VEKSKYAALYLLVKLGLNLNELSFGFDGDELTLETPMGRFIFEYDDIDEIWPGDGHMDWNLSINFTQREGEWDYILNVDAQGHGYRDEVEWHTIENLHSLTRISLTEADYLN